MLKSRQESLGSQHEIWGQRCLGKNGCLVWVQDAPILVAPVSTKKPGKTSLLDGTGTDINLNHYQVSGEAFLTNLEQLDIVQAGRSTVSIQIPEQAFLDISLQPLERHNIPLGDNLQLGSQSSLVPMQLRQWGLNHKYASGTCWTPVDWAPVSTCPFLIKSLSIFWSNTVKCGFVSMPAHPPPHLDRDCGSSLVRYESDQPRVSSLYFIGISQSTYAHFR